MTTILEKKADAFDGITKILAFDRALLTFLKEVERKRPEITTHMEQLVTSAGNNESPMDGNSDEFLMRISKDIMISLKELPVNYNEMLLGVPEVKVKQLKLALNGTVD